MREKHFVVEEHTDDLMIANLDKEDGVVLFSIYEEKDSGAYRRCTFRMQVESQLKDFIAHLLPMLKPEDARAIHEELVETRLGSDEGTPL